MLYRVTPIAHRDDVVVVERFDVERFDGPTCTGWAVVPPALVPAYMRGEPVTATWPPRVRRVGAPA